MVPLGEYKLVFDYTLTQEKSTSIKFILLYLMLQISIISKLILFFFNIFCFNGCPMFNTTRMRIRNSSLEGNMFTKF